jgi:hypothetical protein
MPRFWRDVDSTRRHFGLVIRRNGASLYAGRRLYVALWRRP